MSLLQVYVILEKISPLYWLTIMIIRWKWVVTILSHFPNLICMTSHQHRLVKIGFSLQWKRPQKGHASYGRSVVCCPAQYILVGDVSPLKGQLEKKKRLQHFAVTFLSKWQIDTLSHVISVGFSLKIVHFILGVTNKIIIWGRRRVETGQTWKHLHKHQHGQKTRIGIERRGHGWVIIEKQTDTETHTLTQDERDGRMIRSFWSEKRNEITRSNGEGDKLE